MLIHRLLQRFAMREAIRSAPLPLAWSLGVLKEAIHAGREVVAFHGKAWLVFYPQALREVDGASEVLAHLVGGHPYLQTSRANPPGRCIWLPVAELWGVEAGVRVAGAATGTPRDGDLPARGQREG
jgi:hypothetical protein